MQTGRLAMCHKPPQTPGLGTEMRSVPNHRSGASRIAGASAGRPTRSPKQPDRAPGTRCAGQAAIAGQQLAAQQLGQRDVARVVRRDACAQPESSAHERQRRIAADAKLLRSAITDSNL
jgi:hypothetical protein